MHTIGYLIIFCIILQQSFGVFIPEFQANGNFNENDYIQLPLDSSVSLTNFTICLRVKMYFLRGDLNYFLSYANSDDDNALTGLITYDRQKHQFDLEFCKLSLSECIRFKNLDNFFFNQWTHFCAVFSASESSANQVESNIDLYINGKKVASENIKIKKSKYKPLNGGGLFVLGQEQDDIGGYFDETQSWSGSVTQLEIWSTTTQNVSPDNIEKLASCLIETLDIPERIVQWSENQWSAHGNVSIYQESLVNLCKPPSQLNTFIWPQKITYNRFKRMCDNMNGKLPILTDNGNSNATLEILIPESYQKFTASDEPLVNIEDCILNNDKSLFWLGQIKINGSWTDPYNTSTDFTHFDISLNNDNCAYMWSDHPYQQGCKNAFPCGICDLPKYQILKIKGICERDLLTKYDTDFYSFGSKNGMPYFKGTQISHIFFDKNVQKWTLQSLRDPKIYVQTEKFPLGTSEWTIGADNALCGLENRTTSELTMSLCYPEKYTCNSGSCIPLSDKCDTKKDCHDYSDEINCDFVVLDKKYTKDLIPRDHTGNPLTVYLNVSILAIPKIDVVSLSFTTDFYLNLRWFDLRITYRDLNNNSILNSLSLEDSTAIWTPKLGFNNARGPFQTTVDELTTGVLVRESDPLPEDITLSTEAMLFPGSNNAILLKREYYQEYSCEFDLRYYPFDTQMCEMIFQIQGKTDQYVKLVRDSIGIEFLANKELVEYEIQEVALFTTSVDKISQARARVVFRRRMEYHLSNTIAPTFLLMLVGYLSFFFNVDDFTDRIMVALTSTLVIATLMSSIAEGLPKTFYWKLIDIWMMFTLGMLIITMAFHTLVAKKVAIDENKPLTLLSENSAILRKLAWPGSKKSPQVPRKFEIPNDKADDKLAGAKRLNRAGQIFFVVITFVFVTVFCYISFTEYARPASEYVHKTDDPPLF